MPVADPHGLERRTDFHRTLGFSGFHAHDGRPDATDATATRNLVAVRQQVSVIVNLDQRVSVFANLKCQSFVRSKVSLDHLAKQPVKVGLCTKFHSWFAGHAAMIARYAGHMDLAKLVGKYC